MWRESKIVKAAVERSAYTLNVCSKQYKEQVEPRALSCGQWLRSCVKAPHYVRTTPYLEAEKWFQNFKPGQSEVYDKVLDYAWRIFEQVTDASETLDKKADNLMKSVGLVAGLLGFAFNMLKIGEAKVFVPSLVAFLVSLILAAIACAPTAGPTSASVSDLLDDVTQGHGNVAFLAGSIHCAINGRTSINNWKARRIRWSTWTFVSGLVFLLIPVVALYMS